MVETFVHLIIEIVEHFSENYQANCIDFGANGIYVRIKWNPIHRKSYYYS